MKLKSLLILLFLTAGVFSYVYFAIEKPQKIKESSGGKEDRLAEGKLDLMKSITISTPTQKVELQREAIGWRLLSPVKDLASQSKVENLISGLEKFKKTRVLFTPEKMASNSIDLAQYGLNPPKVSLQYKTSDLADPVSISLGQQNPSGSATYAQTKKEGVVMATMDLDFLSTQKADDYREMRFTTVSSADFDEVEITASGKKMKFKKDKDLWTMSTPYSLPLDQDFARSFMDKIGFVRANQWTATLPTSLSKPDIKIIVGFKEGVKDLRSSDADLRPKGFELDLSRALKPKAKNSKDKAVEYEYFAKGDKTQAGSIAQFHYDNFTKAPEDLIKKTFDDFLNADVQKISITKSKKADFQISKTDKGWISKLGSAEQTLDPEKITKNLDRLRNLRANKFLEISKTVKKLPDLSVTLELKDKKIISFAFDFEKDATMLWTSNGYSVLKYALVKDAVPASEYELDALKPSLTKDAANLTKELPKTTTDNSSAPGKKKP
ncbi:MAG: exported protein of unknown function [Bacteriovoracaceae bacterium]|nr:exported protein of unknown function [Bacteriovoracaceae bacterium]